MPSIALPGLSDTKTASENDPASIRLNVAPWPTNAVLFTPRSFHKVVRTETSGLPDIALSPQAGHKLTVRNFLALYAEALHTYQEMVGKMDKNLQVSW